MIDASIPDVKRCPWGGQYPFLAPGLSVLECEFDMPVRGLIGRPLLRQLQLVQQRFVAGIPAQLLRGESPMNSQI
jgi:hypothetical protein